MKQLSTFILSLFVSLLAGFAGPGFADDTDIYLRQTPDLDDKARPNILFVFDNSGSMLWDIRDPETGEATGERRIDVLRTALLQMLDEIHNVNIGFARFAQINARDIPQYGNKDYPSNAPITFPIFYIDANVNEIEGEIDDTIMDASSQIARSENDAEENVNTQEVSIDEEELEMVQLSTIDEPNGIKVEKEIEGSRDDAGEEGDGNISPAADTITLGQ
ncbi:MAG: hypothetical protein SVR94_16590, partial [Pseudomonadota bacterium]|nr:hypothetical protein [Pseudomonadota bacterium]